MKITIELDNGHVQTFADGQIGECVKADAWESAYNEMEKDARNAKLAQENRELKEQLEYAKTTRAEVCEAKAQEVQKRMALEKELDAQRKENADLFREHREMLDRIGEQNWTIGIYDQENGELREKLEKYETEAANLVWKWDKGSTALTRWAKAIHENAVAHGWWAKSSADASDFHSPAGAGESGPEDGDRPFPEIIALCHSELSEALEEYRNEKPMEYQIKEIGISPYGKPAVDIATDPSEFRDKKKTEGIAVEMIDCIIRILDWCGKENIDVDAVLRRKHEYNKTRPYRHGGKKA